MKTRRVKPGAWTRRPKGGTWTWRATPGAWIRRVGLEAVLAVLGALALLAPLSATRADTSWYQVEVVVFAQDDEAGWQRGNWREEGPPPLAGNTVELLVGSSPGTGAGGSSRRHAFRTLSASGLGLGNAVSRLERAGDYGILLHVGWLQPGFTKRDAPAVHLSAPRSFATGGRFDGSAGQGIDGTVRLWRRRFLHMDVDISFGDIEGWRQRVADEAGPADRPNDRAGTPQVPRGGPGPDTAAPDSGRDLRSAGSAVATVAREVAPETEVKPAAGERLRVVRLVRNLRLDAGALHYVDHPLFGILVLAKRLG